MTTVDEIDVFDQERYMEGVPYEDFAVLRRRAPVFRHRDPQLSEGHWAVTRHSDVTWVARNPALFSSELRGSQPLEFNADHAETQRRMMIHQDPPRHSRVRNLVSRGFTPRVIEAYRSRIASECAEIVDRMLAAGEFDLVELVAAELPLVVIAEVMGIPREDRYKIFKWSKAIAGESDHEQGGPEVLYEAIMEMSAYGAELGRQRRESPVDDVVTRMVGTDTEGNQLTEEELQAFFILMTVAGNETTRYAIAGGVEAFVRFPEQWDRLRAQPDLARSAADEILRWVSPTKVFRRTATEDVELGGETIRAGDKVMAHITSANRDEAVFENPETFDVARTPNPHVSFGGGGPHFCVGKFLAVLEIEELFSELARRVERFEITGPTPRLRSYHFAGITRLPVLARAAV